MDEIPCLACGKTVKMPQYIDSEQYDGQVVCQECKSLLHIKLAKGKVHKYKIVERKFGAFNFTDLVMERRKQQENRSSDRG